MRGAIRRPQVITYGRAASPVGRLLIASTPRGLCAVQIGGARSLFERRLRARFPRAELSADAKTAAAAGRALSAMIGAKAPAASPRLDARGSAFQRLVWDALRRIPVGSTKTYSQVARDVGRPGAARAVARACAANPVAIAIPCHRVIGAGGEPRGYRWGVARKLRLLALEGAFRPA